MLEKEKKSTVLDCHFYITVAGPHGVALFLCVSVNLFRVQNKDSLVYMFYLYLIQYLHSLPNCIVLQNVLMNCTGQAEK